MNGERRFDNAVDAMRGSKWIVAVTVMLPTLIEIIDISVANVSLDHIRGSLSAGIDEASWVLTSYLVSNAIIIPMTGWLARTFRPIAGPLMGGYITDTLSRQWIFYVNIPIGMFAVMMVTMFIVDPPYMKRTEKVRVDTWGIALLTVGLGALQIGLHKRQREDWFHSDFILMFSAISVLSLAAFVIVELFFAEPPILALRALQTLPFL